MDTTLTDEERIEREMLDMAFAKAILSLPETDESIEHHKRWADSLRSDIMSI